MAKLMVLIDIPGMLHDELLEELKDKGSHWWSKEVPGSVVVNEVWLKRSMLDNPSYIFELIGVRP